MYNYKIKLIKVKKVPHKSTNILNKHKKLNIIYKNKSQQIQEQNEKIKQLKIYQNEMKLYQHDIKKIDEFNLQHKLNFNNNILLNLRNENYINSIDHYTEHLLLPKNIYLNNQDIEIINRLWKTTYDKMYFFKKFFLEEKWDILCDGRYDNTFRINKIIEKYKLENKTIDIISEWMDNNPYNNLYKILKPIKSFILFNITDYSATSNILTRERNDYAKNCNKTIDNIIDRCNQMEKTINIQKQFDSIKINNQNVFNKISLISEVFPEFNFDKVCIDEFEARVLTNMHNAVISVLGGKEWFINCNDIYMSNDPIRFLILYHRKVLNDGHSGTSMYWTINTLKYIYKNGWNDWCLKKLNKYIR